MQQKSMAHLPFSLVYMSVCYSVCVYIYIGVVIIKPSYADFSVFLSCHVKPHYPLFLSATFHDLCLCVYTRKENEWFSSLKRGEERLVLRGCSRETSWALSLLRGTLRKSLLMLLFGYDPLIRNLILRTNSGSRFDLCKKQLLE